MQIDVTFPLQAQHAIPADHGYALYSALSRQLPAIHSFNGVGIHAIRGRQIGDHRMQLCDWSHLTLRTSTERIGDLLPLAGKSLGMGESRLRIGVPQVFALRPAPALRSRLVTIKLKDGIDEEAFSAAARRQLDALNVSSECILTLGPRRTLRIKDKEVIGYEVILEGLSAEESLDVQENGLGGRRHMGCGIFTALR